MNTSPTLSTFYLGNRNPDKPPIPHSTTREAVTLSKSSSRGTAKRPVARRAPGVRVLVVFEESYRAYREAISNAIRTLRPRAEVVVAGPGALEARLERLNPHLVICSQPNLLAPGSPLAWVEIPYDTGRPSTINLAGKTSESANLTLDELLSIFDEVAKLPETSRHPGNNPRCA